MELVGLQKALRKVDQKKIEIQSFTTDRHPSVKKYMREQRPLVAHWFDVWHVAKGEKDNISKLCTSTMSSHIIFRFKFANNKRRKKG